MPKLSIIIPCYNEQATVAELLRRVSAVSLPEGWEREVIVVDDASDDGTQEMLRSLLLPVCLIFRDANGGKGTALKDGFAYASGEYVLIQDADLEYDPSDIPVLLAALGGKRTAVFGSRYLNLGNRSGSRLLRLGVGSITWLINRLYGSSLTDACTCYKLFPREAISLFPDGGFDADALFAPALLAAGYEIREAPVSYVPRTVAEGKKIKYRDGFRILYLIVVRYFRSDIMYETSLKGQ